MKVNNQRNQLYKTLVDKTFMCLKNRVFHKKRGVALVMVLWLTTLLSLMASSLALTVRRETTAVSNGLAFAQARHGAVAGVRHAQLHLLAHLNAANTANATSTTPEKIFNQLHNISFADGLTIQFTIQPETSKVDLNTAPAPLLAGLLSVVGVTEERQRQQIVDAILSWRDTTALGNEAEAYKAAGYSYRPRHAEFASIYELQSVLGITSALYQRLAPLITVHSRQTGIYTPAALPLVLMALPGASATHVDDYIALRRLPRGATQPPPLLAGADPVYTTDTEGQIFSVIAAAQRADTSIRVALEQVVSYQPSREKPFVVLAERWLDRDEEAVRLVEQ